MSAELDDLHRARRINVATGLHLAAMEMRLDEKTASMTALTKAEARNYLAARALYLAVEALPAERKRQIPGWIEPPLINPATCGEGDCGACDGAPCEHECHLKGDAP